MKDMTPIFCSLALDAAQSKGLPTREKADLYDYAAHSLNQDGYPELASAALLAAKDLRNAEAAQSHFDALISSALEVNKVH